MTEPTTTEASAGATEITVEGASPPLAPPITSEEVQQAAAAAPAQPFDLAKRTEQYVKLRDLINERKEAHKKELQPLQETLEQLNSLILDHLNSIGADSVATNHGTVYRTAKHSASVSDMSSFWAYVVAAGDWDLIDKKANVSAVRDFIEKNNTPPPGVNFTTRHVVGVRRR